MASRHLERVLERRAAEHQEDIAREVRNYGQVRPVEARVGSKGWKSYSRIRRPSPAYREGYDAINWSS